MSKTAQDSPFHAGEREIQSRLGVRDMVERMGQRVIRDAMPDQHRRFYQQLPMLITASVDAQGQPWASVLVGRPGFIQTPDQRCLHINTQPIYGDPLADNLQPGKAIGVLGIEYQSRRRNRMSTRVASTQAGSIALDVVQAFGNCPQYIQAREPEFTPAIDKPGEELPVVDALTLDGRAQAIISSADHFYIATSFEEDPTQASQGADASHRGGKPGFVRILDDNTLVFPDFSGNNHYNTLGNIALNPVAGLLFIDYQSGDLLYLTGTAEVIWDSEQIKAYKGAERLVRFVLRQARLVERGMPIRWRGLEYSPSLDLTGSWEEADAAIAARRAASEYRELQVTAVERESESVSSFYLEPRDGKPLPRHRAGQFLPIALALADGDSPLKRTYTISNAPNGQYYRLSIKRENAPCPDVPAGQSSSYFHDSIRTGAVVRAQTPRGHFSLVPSSDRPVVLLSAGVGVTPMVSMLEQLTEHGDESPSVFFIHGARNGREHAFRDHVRQLARTSKNVVVHNRYSAPDPQDAAGVDFDSSGRIDMGLIKRLLPFDDYDFYLCGPEPFMRSLHQGLLEMNIQPSRIHHEFFGPGSNLNPKEQATEQGVAQPKDTTAVKVRFEKSGKQAMWHPDQGSLLDLAEAEGLRPDYSCRAGVCGSCETRVISGDVAYRDPPLAAIAEDSALICCAHPATIKGDLVLDL